MMQTIKFLGVEFMMVNVRWRNTKSGVMVGNITVSTRCVYENRNDENDNKNKTPANSFDDGNRPQCRRMNMMRINSIRNS